EPALLRHVGRQRVLQKNAAGAIAQEFLPVLAEDEGDIFRRRLGHGWLVADQSLRLLQLEPVEAVALQRQLIRGLADQREDAAAKQLDRDPALERREVERKGLRRARQVGAAQHRLAFILAQERQ